MKKADNFDAKKWLVENKITTQSRIKEGLSEEDLVVGTMYDLYFKDKPSWKWFKGVKLSEITPTELIFRWEGSNGGWDIDVDKKEFLENDYIKPSELAESFGILQDKPLEYVLVVYDTTDESDPTPPIQMIFTSESEENLKMSKFDLLQIINDIDSKVSLDSFETEGPMLSDEFKSRYGYSIPRNLLYVI